MIYRTVTVEAEPVTNSITATAELSGDIVRATADVLASIEANAELSNNIVPVSAEVSNNITVEAELTTVITGGSYDYYSGPYQVTPTTQTQTLSTSGKVLVQNVVINPIPSNYGLITWDGATLTVS